MVAARGILYLLVVHIAAPCTSSASTVMRNKGARIAVVSSTGSIKASISLHTNMLAPVNHRIAPPRVNKLKNNTEREIIDLHIFFVFQ